MASLESIGFFVLYKIYKVLGRNLSTSQNLVCEIKQVLMDDITTLDSHISDFAGQDLTL